MVWTFLSSMVAIALATWLWSAVRSARMLRQWAEAAGYEIIAARRRFVRRGPFFWTAASGEAVFRVRVVDTAGLVHAGWVRCGGFWTMATENVYVQWDMPTEMR